MVAVAEVKTRAPRKVMTEFGQSLRGFVSAVNQTKLAIKVGVDIGETDQDKVHASIQNLVRKAGQNSAVVSIRSKPLVEAVIKNVVELDADLAAKGETLKKAFQYEQISSANREPGQNWIVRLKSGEEVAIKEGPDGDGMYKLQWMGEIPAAVAAAEAEVEA
jgi:predicted nuclease with TOPRIM domain